MKSSIQIQNEVLDLNEQNERLSADFNAAKGDAQAAIHDQIVANSARVKALNEQLSEVLAYEDDIRKNGGVPLAAPTDAARKPALGARTLAEIALGARDQFKGLKLNDRIDFDVADAYTDFGLVKREETDYSLPAQYPASLPNFGVLDVLPKATTDADSLKFFRADLSKYVNNAAPWEPGNLKPTSSMAWDQDTAEMELVANGMPVLETELKDYGQLSALINGNLQLMQRLYKGKAVVSAPASRKAKGIVGILNTEGILTRAKGAKETIADTIRKQKTDIFLSTGMQPTHVAMHPYVSENIELEKDANGRYINQMVNGKLWALTVVNDLNLSTTTGDGDSAKTTYGMLTFWPQAATFFTREQASIAVGIINDQFMRNEKTVRIEERCGLMVRFPGAFSYVADTGITR